MKQFGQHFLTSNIIPDRICGLINIENMNVFEVGAGRGILTCSILNHKPKKLVAIEIDKNLDIYLKMITQQNFHYLIDDVKKYTLKYISQNYFNGESFIIIANLPYNIGTRLLVDWYNDFYCSDIVIMLQKEVVDRICAQPNSKQYGKLSVLSQYVMTVEKCFTVGPEYFHKPPKVESAVFKGSANIIDINKLKVLNDITTMFFLNRRKVLKSKFIDLFGSEANFFNDFWNKRAENLSLVDYLNIAESVMKR
ncbi:MAG: 16S rRNA (adenine(1518)-N(6)/adenine(1519)-N(6))-dimethyltransferase RsmA [Pseudomonadota bacterium]